MRTEDYPFIAWNSVTVVSGASIANASANEPLTLDWQPGGIRTCSHARNRNAVGITGVDRSGEEEGLWVFDLATRQRAQRVAIDHVLNHALDADAATAAVATAERGAPGANLDTVNLADDAYERLVSNRLHHSSSLSWLPDGDRIAYQTAGDDIEVIDRRTRAIEQLTSGRLPVVSPSGDRIAFVRNVTLMTIDLRSHRETSFDTGGKQPTANLSWSPDERLVSFGVVQGLVGKEIGFYLYDLETGQQDRADIRFMSGFAIVGRSLS